MQLETHPFFSNFDPHVAASLRRFVTSLNVAPGAFLFHEGDAADALYLVLEGEVELVKELPGRIELLARCGEGDYFGELAVMDASGRASGARAVGPVTLGRLPGEPFVSALRGAPGRVALGVLHKIVENLRATNERFMSYKLASEKLGVVGEMAGSVAQDLQAPFAAIKQAADGIAERHPQDARTVDLCRAITEEVHRSLSMIEDLLQYSRGGTELERRPVVISELAARLLELNQAFLRKAGATLSVDVAAETAELDGDRLLRALQNLVNNAVEAFEGRPGTVRLEGRREDGRLVLAVRDDGPGIPSNIRDRVFEPFVTYGKPGSTGLGLPIARSIIEAHGGTITLHTVMGKGTTFTIELPG
jgi:signal transduction histidine kinase